VGDTPAVAEDLDRLLEPWKRDRPFGLGEPAAGFFEQPLGRREVGLGLGAREEEQDYGKELDGRAHRTPMILRQQ
jgi:hypothetical protein